MANFPPPPPAVEAPVASAPAAMRGRIVFASVQLGAFPSRVLAEQARRGYSARATAQLRQPLRVQAATVNGHQWFRLMAGPFPATDAHGLCHDLSSQRLACMVRPEGDTPTAPTAVAVRAPYRRMITLARARIAAPRPLSSENYAGQ